MIMKKTILIFIVFFTVFSCNNSAIEKPDNLISEDMMVDIIYDLSLLEGIRSTNYNTFKERGINPSKYIYTKYKIDSLQFVKSDRYYASDIELYAKIYDEVSKRIEDRKKAVDSLGAKTPKPAQKTNREPKADSILAKKREMLRKLNSRSENIPK